MAPKSPGFIFQPQPDITVQELAEILKLLTITAGEELISRQSSDVQRHFWPIAEAPQTLH